MGQPDSSEHKSKDESLSTKNLQTLSHTKS